MKSKVAGIVFIIGSLYYIITEAISATFSRLPLQTLTFSTPFPNLEFLMRIRRCPYYELCFILIGLTLIFGNFYKFKDFIVKNKVIFYVFTLITGLGVIIVGLIHGGNPFTLGYHMLGAMMAILGGNILIVIISRSMADFDGFQKITLSLGTFGIVIFWVMFFNMESIYMPVFERLSVYTLIIWSFLTGIYLIRS